MNERIKEMWEESTGSMFPRPGSFTAGEYDYHLEKFAELIVRECIDICNKGISTDTDWDNSYWNQACENRAYAIKQHFGVKE